MAKKKTEPQPEPEVVEVNENFYTLRRGREQPFRRTVNLTREVEGEGGELVEEKYSVQLVFEPGVDIELSPVELEQCADIIASQMIVPAIRDAKGRLRVMRTPADTATIASLTAKNDELEARVAELTALLDEVTVAEPSTADGVE